MQILLLNFLPGWIPVEEISPTRTSSLAGWIACLLQYEMDHGRNAWSWTELAHARARVLDPYIGSASLPEWAITSWSMILHVIPLLILLITFAGFLYYYRFWKQKRWTNCILVTVLWFLTLWILLLIKEPARIPSAVIQQAGLLMRQGNGLSYDPCRCNDQPVKLAEGVEARLLAERDNGWVKIELVQGISGWVPREGVIVVK